MVIAFAHLSLWDAHKLGPKLIRDWSNDSVLQVKKPFESVKLCFLNLKQHNVVLVLVSTGYSKIVTESSFIRL